ARSCDRGVWRDRAAATSLSDFLLEFDSAFPTRFGQTWWPYRPRYLKQITSPTSIHVPVEISLPNIDFAVPSGAEYSVTAWPSSLPLFEFPSSFVQEAMPTSFCFGAPDWAGALSCRRCVGIGLGNSYCFVALRPDANASRGDHHRKRAQKHSHYFPPH